MNKVTLMYQSTPERGQASILVALDKSCITVVHGSTGQKLMSGKVNEDWWDELFSFLEAHLEREEDLDPDPLERNTT